MKNLFLQRLDAIAAEFSLSTSYSDPSLGYLIVGSLGIIAGYDGGRLANINLDNNVISLTTTRFYTGDGIGNGRISMTVNTLMSASLSDPQLEEKLREVMRALAVKDMIHQCSQFSEY